jgi:hypothetical protein
MFKWLKALLKARVAITVIYPPALGVETTTTPRIIEHPAPYRAVHRSNYRFVEHECGQDDGSYRTYYCTEMKGPHGWSQVSGTWTGEKDVAMRLHLRVLEKGAVKPPDIKTILWEGLSPDETKSWVELQLPHEEE